MHPADSEEHSTSDDFEIRLKPLDGTPEVLSRREDIIAAGKALRDGRGLLAVDTERASAFRYDDRAFLIQLRRRGAGTFLIDPELGRAAISQLGGYLNDLTWIIHAAPSDLPCLAALGLYPDKLIDTELAGRLLGARRANLAALTEEFLNVGLAKGHGQENWSKRPLPEEWLDYAALDVELLEELAIVLTDALGELGRYEWLEQECAHMLHENQKYSAGLDIDQDWRRLKGVGKLRQPRQLNIARALWEERDRIARARDLSPTKILPHQTLRAIAESVPTSQRELGAIRGFPRKKHGASESWFRVIDRALHSPSASWPRAERSEKGNALHFKKWVEHAPAAAALYDRAHAAINVATEGLGIRPDLVITSAQTCELVWWMHTTAEESWPNRSHSDYARGLPDAADIFDFLSTRGARPWQAEFLSDVIGEQVLLPMRNTEEISGV
nr:HRDC domain-containing protein [Corynebacterium lactis]